MTFVRRRLCWMVGAGAALPALIGLRQVYISRVANFSEVVIGCYQHELDSNRTPRCQNSALEIELERLRAREGEVQNFRFDRLGLEFDLSHWSADVYVTRKGTGQIESVSNNATITIHRGGSFK